MRKKGKYAEHRIKCRKIDQNVKKMSYIFKEKKTPTAILPYKEYFIIHNAT